MPVVPCPHCANPVTLPPTWTGSAYTCPHCRRVAGAVPPPRPTPPPVPVPPPPPPLSFDDDGMPTQPRRRRQPTGNPIWDFLTFRLMITPILIQIVFWLGVIGCVLTGANMIGASFGGSTSEKKVVGSESIDADGSSGRTGVKNAKTSSVSSAIGSWSFVSGVTILVFGPLIVRLYCELLIIIFKIHDELKAANDRRGRT